MLNYLCHGKDKINMTSNGMHWNNLKHGHVNWFKLQFGAVKLMLQAFAFSIACFSMSEVKNYVYWGLNVNFRNKTPSDLSDVLINTNEQIMA